MSYPIQSIHLLLFSESTLISHHRPISSIHLSSFSIGFGPILSDPIIPSYLILSYPILFIFLFILIHVISYHIFYHILFCFYSFLSYPVPFIFLFFSILLFYSFLSTLPCLIRIPALSYHVLSYSIIFYIIL